MENKRTKVKKLWSRDASLWTNEDEKQMVGLADRG